MTTRKLRLMPAVEVPPSNATILEPPQAPAIQGGGGPDSLLCGGCGTALVTDITDGGIANIFIRCPACKAMNDVNP